MEEKGPFVFRRIHRRMRDDLWRPFLTFATIPHHNTAVHHNGSCFKSSKRTKILKNIIGSYQGGREGSIFKWLPNVSKKDCQHYQYKAKCWQMLLNKSLDVLPRRIKWILPSKFNISETEKRTVYGCEGSNLELACEAGLVIQLVRANYGRFSISICNKEGNTAWSVNCMEPRSLRVINTR